MFNQGMVELLERKQKYCVHTRRLTLSFPVTTKRRND
uniref:Uncharacterized protein n=1 Tax=Lepeophtheirus salmonis TaxID=72036 RepID=A0A0K2UUE4_LEPSM